MVTNKNIGHSFPPELRDFYEAYIEFTVTDSTNKPLYKSGYIKPDGYLDEYAHNYKTYLVHPDGSPNELHHIWKTRVIPQNLAIPSGRSDVARYRFAIPANLSGNFKISAKLQYRRFTRIFSDYVLGKSTDYPIVTMAATEKTLSIGNNTAEEPNPKALPDWRRWNNYGIALLDQRQFAAAADAFANASEMDEKYRPFALTNRALALMEIDRWVEARKLIDKALELDPGNYRALFQHAAGSIVLRANLIRRKWISGRSMKYFHVIALPYSSSASSQRSRTIIKRQKDTFSKSFQLIQKTLVHTII